MLRTASALAPRLSALRVTLALGTAAIVVGSVACGSAPEDGESAATTGEAATSSSGGGSSSSSGGPIRIANCLPGYARVPPSIACQPLISTEASKPNLTNPPDLGCYLTGPIAVPPELAGLGCSLGTWYNGNLSRLWACPAGTPAPPTIAGFFPVTTGYSPWPELDYVSPTYEWDSACLGNPLPGWEFIVQSQVVINGACPNGCPGNVPLGPGGKGTK